MREDIDQNASGRCLTLVARDRKGICAIKDEYDHSIQLFTPDCINGQSVTQPPFT